MMGISSSRQLASHVIENCDKAAIAKKDLSKALVQDNVFLSRLAEVWRQLSAADRSKINLALHRKPPLNFLAADLQCWASRPTEFLEQTSLARVDLATNPLGQLHHLLENFALDGSREILLYRLCLLACHRLVKEHTSLRNIGDAVIAFGSSYESRTNVVQSWSRWAKLGGNYERLIDGCGGYGALLRFSHEDPQWSNRSSRLVQSYQEDVRMMPDYAIATKAVIEIWNVLWKRLQGHSSLGNQALISSKDETRGLAVRKRQKVRGGTVQHELTATEIPHSIPCKDLYNFQELRSSQPIIEPQSIDTTDALLNSSFTPSARVQDLGDNLDFGQVDDLRSSLETMHTIRNRTDSYGRLEEHDQANESALHEPLDISETLTFDREFGWLDDFSRMIPMLPISPYENNLAYSN